MAYKLWYAILLIVDFIDSFCAALRIEATFRATAAPCEDRFARSKFIRDFLLAKVSHSSLRLCEHVNICASKFSLIFRVNLTNSRTNHCPISSSGKAGLPLGVVL
jgi:hypothetical protein